MAATQARALTTHNCCHCVCCIRYVEVHMEQGPVLQDRGVALAPVAAIAGQSRLALTLHGTQVHALRERLPTPFLIAFAMILYG